MKGHCADREPVVPVEMTLIRYDERDFSQKNIGHPSEAAVGIGDDAVTWINVDGIHDETMIEDFGRLFDLHPLLLEDVKDTAQRPKLEEFPDHVFIVVKMLTCKGDGRIDSEQVSLVLGWNYVITFQEKPGDVFGPVRDCLRTAKGKIRKLGADFLAYSLLNAVVEHYFVILENFGEEFEIIEEELLAEPTSSTTAKMHALRRDLVFLRRSVWPLRDVVKGLDRSEGGFFKKGTLVFMRDIYDHTVQVIDSIETYRDILSGMFDIYLSSISFKMNSVMKVLTIISTIFIPLTFIVGLYGMNFDFMPELRWKWGYPAVWGFILGTGGIMIYVFKRMKWL